LGALAAAPWRCPYSIRDAGVVHEAHAQDLGPAAQRATLAVLMTINLR
jgi:hypothetical protein